MVSLQPLFLTLGLCLFSAVLADHVRADDADAIRRVEIGIGGQYKIGRWTPIQVDIADVSPATVVEVTAPDPVGNPTTMPLEVVSSSQPGRFTGTFRCGRLEGNIIVEIRDNERIVARSWTPVVEHPQPDAPAIRRLSDYTIATIGAPAGFADLTSLNETSNRGSESRDTSVITWRVVDLDGTGSLPDSRFGLDGLDALVLSSRFDVSSRQSDAIRLWVLNGGHLVVSIGSASDVFRSSPLSAWMQPVLTVAPETRRLRDFELSNLERFAGRGNRIPLRGQRVDAAVFEAKDATVLADSVGGPLLVEIPFGLGRLTVCAADLSTGPLVRWETLPYFCARLIRRQGGELSSSASNRRGRLSHSGTTDLASQVASSQQQFPGVERVSSWTVMAAIVCYLLLIGPLDYLIVHRILRRPGLTWITFPAMVAVGAVLAVGLAASTNGEALRVNQLDLLDLDAGGTGTGRYRSWFTIYGKNSERHELAVVANSHDRQALDAQPASSLPATATRISWTGIPENAFGGMYRSGGFALNHTPYNFASGSSRIENQPLRIWSTQSLTGEWSVESEPVISVELTSTAIGALNGRLTHQLPFAIREWIVAYGTRVYRPRLNLRNPADAEIPAGRVWSPTAPNVQQRDLRSWLTGTTARRVRRSDRTNGEDIVSEQSSYDPGSHDVEYALRMMTFHAMAGGHDYTGLDCAALREFDLTPQLGLNRAVLFGQFDLETCRLTIDGQDAKPTHHEAFVRILLPVRRTGTTLNELPVFDINKKKEQGEAADSR